MSTLLLYLSDDCIISSSDSKVSGTFSINIFFLLYYSHSISLSLTLLLALSLTLNPTILNHLIVHSHLRRRGACKEQEEQKRSSSSPVKILSF